MQNLTLRHTLAPLFAVLAIGVSAPAAKANWSNVYPIPPREGEIEMIAGDTPEEQARNLVNKLFEEKVI